MKFDSKVKTIIIIRRFFELVISEVALSAALTMLSMFEFASSFAVWIVSMITGVLFFYGINIWQLRSCFFDLRDYKLFYLLNLISCFAFAAVDFLLISILPATVYSLLFSITELFHLVIPKVSVLLSAALFHLICCVVVIVSPVGMSWLLEIPDTNPYETR